MKIIATAMALAIATPAVAQTAQPSHQGDHPMEMPMDHAQHQGMPHRMAQSGHGEHDGCCQDRDGNGVMDCCEHMAADHRDGCPEHGQPSSAQHQGH